jgi:hypothetical protein
VKSQRIKEDDEYQGVRLHLEARMGAARLALQIDVGFGDTITPSPARERLLTLLDFPAPTILVCPWETVIAEKFQAIMELGMDNSRMKDFFDIDYLSKTQPFAGPVLAHAIQATSARRKTPLPDRLPVGLAPGFGEDAVKRTQWRAFTRRLQVDALPLREVLVCLRAFLLPPVTATLQGHEFTKRWPPGGPWG